jgi:hypothetical protein
MVNAEKFTVVKLVTLRSPLREHYSSATVSTCSGLQAISAKETAASLAARGSSAGADSASPSP